MEYVCLSPESLHDAHIHMAGVLVVNDMMIHFY